MLYYVSSIVIFVTIINIYIYIYRKLGKPSSDHHPSHMCGEGEPFWRSWHVFFSWTILRIVFHGGNNEKWNKYNYELNWTELNWIECLQLGGFYIWTYSYHLVKTSSLRLKQLEELEATVQGGDDFHTHLLPQKPEGEHDDVVPSTNNTLKEVF